MTSPAWSMVGSMLYLNKSGRLFIYDRHNKEEVWSLENPADPVWPDAHLGQRTVDTHVRRLREKLGDAAEWLETVRGVGYRMRSEPPLTRSQPF